MDIRLPDTDTVEALHEIILEASSGRSGIHDRSLVVRAIERPSTYIHYVDDYDIDTVCALLADGIARYHGFNDGNKRTALMTVIFTYKLNDIDFQATDEMNIDFDEFVMWIVREKPSIDQITERLKELRSTHEGTGGRETWVKLFTFLITKAAQRKLDK